MNRKKQTYEKSCVCFIDNHKSVLYNNLVVDELEKFYKALMHVEDTDENNQCE